MIQAYLDLKANATDTNRRDSQRFFADQGATLSWICELLDLDKAGVQAKAQAILADHGSFRPKTGDKFAAARKRRLAG